MSDAQFYDVKARKKVKVPVVGKIVYGEKGRERYALRAQTADGRNLTKFVSKADFDKSDAPVAAAAKAKAKAKPKAK